MFGIGNTEIIIILAVVLLFFGASRIPSLAKGLGSGIRIFKSSLRGEFEGKDDVALRDNAPHDTSTAGKPNA